MAVKFYNPGSKIFEKLAFDHPTNDIKQMNLISYFQIDAAEKSFFEVPTEVTVNAESGEQAVAVRFADRIQKDYRDLGVVRINPKAKDINEDDNVALNEKDAKDKGERLWKECMQQLVRDHVKAVNETKHAGLTPSRAKGTVAHAFKTLGIEDPANDVADVLNRSQDNDRVTLLEKQLEELKTILLAKKA